MDTFISSANHRPSVLHSRASSRNRPSREHTQIAFQEKQRQSRVNLLILRLILRLLRDLKQSSQQPPTTPTATASEQHAPQTNSVTSQNVMLGEKQTEIISALFKPFSTEELKPSVQEGLNHDGKLGVNDTLSFKNNLGETLSTKTLTTKDIYDIRFRENMIKLTQSVPNSGWSFNENGLVKIKGRALRHPEQRLFIDEFGRSTREIVIERNNYWETVIRDDRRFLIQREFDDSGRSIRSSDALKHLIDHPFRYAFDCSTPMPILSLLATMKTIGEDDFNHQTGSINLSGWLDQYDSTQFDGGFNITSRFAKAGDIQINNRENIAGEYALFDPGKGDTLIPGGGYYFDLPGDDSSSYQGWNAVYQGRSNDNGYLFWTADIGTQNIHFQQDSWIPSNSRFRNHYLSAYVATTDTSRLARWDRDQSAVT